MSTSDIGFSFQADVTNAGSLVHLAAGRALKALSDGGIDFYAVVAVVHTLGKQFSVRSSLELSVHSHIVAKGRTVFQSVLAKALKIGWGHSVLAEEIARTRAGINSLLLVNALATGSSYFLAAEILSELLVVHGCEADRLPNIDALAHMIGYLTPFVQNLGFPAILSHITTTALRPIIAKKHHMAKDHLTRHGDAPCTAGIIGQLILTSQNHETVYLITRMRGAWFATFASHILGMAVKLRLDDVVIWESAGSNGTAIIELGEHHQNESVISTSDNKILLLNPPGPERQDGSLEVSYHIKEAFDSLMVYFPEINDELRNAIRRAICRLSKGNLKAFSHGGNFNSYEALEGTLNAFGFDSAFINAVGQYIPHFWEDSVKDPLSGLEALDQARDVLTTRCKKHNGGNFFQKFLKSKDWDCLCGRVGKLIIGFATAITALMQCKFDPLELRLSASILLKGPQSFPEIRPFASTPGDIRGDIIYRPNWALSTMDYLMSLTCDADDEQLGLAHLNTLSKNNGILGVSGGSHTLYYTCLLRNDCFDSQGRVFSLSNGRASVNGVLRRILLEKRHEDMFSIYSRDQEVSTSLGPGAIIEPHYVPSNTNVYLDVSLKKDYILTQFTVGSDKHRAERICIERCIIGLLYCNTHRCNHDTKAQFKVEKEHKLELVGFGLPSDPNLHSRLDNIIGNKQPVRLSALRGNKLEQVITICFIQGRRPWNQNWRNPVFQFQACLGCCVKVASEHRTARHVIMGG